jgi:glycosyltransferase involved in cell wall biosynthesis
VKEEAMHVLWVNEHARFTGGAERYVHDTARRLGASGIRSSLLYDVPGWTEPSFLAPFAGAYPLVDAARQIREIAPDVVYVHRAEGASAIDGIAAGGAPVLRFFHDHRPFCLREHKYTALGQRTCTRTLGPGCYSCLGFVVRREGWPGVSLKSLAPLRSELDASRRLRGVVVGSRYMARHVAAHGFDPARIHVLPLYAEEPAEMHESRQEGLFLFVGQLVTGKGVDVLLRALAGLSGDVRLLLVGMGRKEGFLRAEAARLGLGARAEFLGPRSGLELDRLYARATAVVLPSRSPETFGLTGPEAMRFGTPVVATTVGGIDEWLEDGVTGLAVPPGDENALGAALRRLSSWPGLAARLGRGARARYVERFRPEGHIAGLARLLHEVSH